VVGLPLKALFHTQTTSPIVDSYVATAPAASVGIESAKTPSAEWYTQPDFLVLEKERVFMRSWQAVGRIDEVATPGQYFTGELLGEPFVVLRDESSTLHAFFNVCRHHAARVAQGSGCVGELKCPYHGWTYSLDGRLKKATKLKGIKDFSPKENGLLPIDVRIWGSNVWINMSKHVNGAPVVDLDNQLRALHKQISDNFGSMNKLKFVRRRTYDLKCNWKVYVENYCDGGYHVNHLHPNLGGLLDLSSYTTEVHNLFSVQYANSAKAQSDSAKMAIDTKKSDRIGNKVIYAFIFPNFMINSNIMDTNFVLPTGVDTCRVVFDYYFSESEQHNQQFIGDCIAASDVVQQEDITICEDVQKGVSSLAYGKTSGRYAPSIETPMYHFHSMLANAAKGV
jgi:choline monooxygenase